MVDVSDTLVRSSVGGSDRSSSAESTADSREHLGKSIKLSDEIDAVKIHQLFYHPSFNFTSRQ